jgi:hypothetical protein
MFGGILQCSQSYLFPLRSSPIQTSNLLGNRLMVDLGVFERTHVAFLRMRPINLFISTIELKKNTIKSLHDLDTKCRHPLNRQVKHFLKYKSLYISVRLRVMQDNYNCPSFLIDFDAVFEY